MFLSGLRFVTWNIVRAAFSNAHEIVSCLVKLAGRNTTMYLQEVGTNWNLPDNRQVLVPGWELSHREGDVVSCLGSRV